ncbi:hypothetical protein [Mesorhizobium loti]|uniref:hypothetical protein n=1 Tax=Rhizobium loti TaxID=381 RepID=UPI0012679CF1|nr:hypothetical protein [Mesorhizobium loti]
MRETAVSERSDKRRRVTYAGKTSTRSDFDPKKFALSLIEKRVKKPGIEEREARLRRAEAAVAAAN